MSSGEYPLRNDFRFYRDYRSWSRIRTDFVTLDRDFNPASSDTLLSYLPHLRELVGRADEDALTVG